MKPLILTLLGICAGAVAQAQTSAWLRLPERTRLLVDQRVDLLVEVRNTESATLRVTANGTDITSSFGAAVRTNLDCDAAPDVTFRANLYGFQQAGNVNLVATVTTPSGTFTDSRQISVLPFSLANRRNIILYIGDAMGTSYRDAARIIGRSADVVPGVSGLREGYFDNLLEMDKMPVSGMAMTYSSDRIVPDSANTASTWSTGNKIFYNAMGVFEDGTDCTWRAAGRTAATLSTMIDNPRVETLWEYLKRKHGYRTGVVTTADVTDATPAGEGSHTAHRETRAEITNQYLASPMLSGEPVYDVILGGGLEQFEADKRADRRDMVAAFRGKGFSFVGNAAELRQVTGNTNRVLGLFRRGNAATLNSSGIRATPDGNMDVAYDKLNLTRPGSEPLANFNGFTDQPFLDLMTDKAISVLSAGGTQPFILMVEGASIDKQSHPNQAAGTVWDTLEFDRAIGVGRRFAQGRTTADTLVVVSADHDQSMHIIGVTTATDTDMFDRTGALDVVVTAPSGTHNTKIFRDANTNVRSNNMYNNSGGDPNNSTGREGPPALYYGNIADTGGFPEYLDLDGDGYPDNKMQGPRGARKLSLGFRTGNHTGSSVPVTAEGPGAFLFTGYMDQGDIMFKMAATLSTDTATLDAAVRLMQGLPTNPKTPGK